MSWMFSRALMDSVSWRSLRGLGEESLEASSSDGEQCAQLSVMPTRRKFWRNDKTMDASSHSRFGLTCAVLKVSDGEAVLMSFLAAFPVRTYPSPERGKESPGSEVVSGEKWRELLVKFDRSTSSWRTHLCLWEEVLPESSVTLPRSGMMRRGMFWERMTSGLPMCANDSGLLFPTPKSADATKGDCASERRRRSPSLVSAVKMWPTPTVSGNHNKKGASQKSGNGLATAVKMWPTPNHRDWKDSGTSQGNRKSPNLGTMVHRQEQEEGGGQLNPAWVEWLMGWPIGWTDLKPLETDRFRQWQRAHGSVSQEMAAKNSRHKTKKI